MDDYQKQWIKAASPTPGKAEFALAEQFARKGTKAAMALAMYARAKGATRNQIIEAIGSPQMVLRAKLVEAGKLVETRTQAGREITYRVALPTKAPRRATTKAAGKRKAPGRAKRSR